MKIEISKLELSTLMLSLTHMEIKYLEALTQTPSASEEARNKWREFQQNANRLYKKLELIKIRSEL